MSARRKGKPQQRKNIESSLLAVTIDFCTALRQTIIEPEQDLLTCGDCQREFVLSDIVRFIQHKVSRCNKENVQPPFDGCHEDDDDDDDDDNANNSNPYQSNGDRGGGGSLLASIISSHRTSISAPINRRDAEVAAPVASSSSAISNDAPHNDEKQRNKDGGEGEDDDDTNHNSSQGNNTTTTTTTTTTIDKASGDENDDAEGGQDNDAQREGGGGDNNSDDVKVKENGIDIHSSPKEGKSSKRKSGNNQPIISEPSIFTCGTCKSVYSSSWFLVQHVQKTHGLKIYEEPRDVSPPPTSIPPPPRPIVVQPEKQLLADHLRAGGKNSPATTPSSPFHKTGGRHRSPTCSPRTGDMFSSSSFPTPFMPGAPRQPSSANTWPYGRSPMSDFAAMIHPDLMMDQLRRLQGLVAGADHPAIPGIPFLRPPPSLDNQYSHSERLRLLAATGGGATSPKHIPPRSKPDTFTSPTQSTPPSAFTTPTTTTSSVPSHDSSVGGSLTRQLKQCEFCSKQFRFASNLVLHRRLHTGERPYACPLCTFTSAQATKLRTHMRSHVTSPADTTAAPTKLSDSDIEDTEEFVAREAGAEAAIRQLEREAKQQKEEDQSHGDEPTDLSSNGGGRQSVDSQSPAPTARDEEEEEEDIVADRASLLSEVMMKTGLSSLPNYKEAFESALAEANNANKSPKRHSPKPDTPTTTKDEKTEETTESSPVKIEPQDKDESVHDYTDGEVEEENDDSVVDDESHSISSQRRSPQSHASSDYSSTEQPPEKRIKRETSPSATAGLTSSSPSSTFPGADHLFQRAAMEAAATHSLYPGLWFPPTSSASPASLPFSPFMHRAGGEHAAAAMMSAAAANSRLQAAAAASTSENGLSPQASSAFSNNGSPKLPSPDPSGLSSLAQGAKRRNDTCEYCGKIFKNCSNLTVHRRSHTGEKPYKCQLCPYACAQSSKLTRHMRTHGRHGKDVYRCKFCCMPFSVPSTLEKHMRKCVESQQRAAAARHLTSPLAPMV